MNGLDMIAKYKTARKANIICPECGKELSEYESLEKFYKENKKIFSVNCSNCKTNYNVWASAEFTT